MTRAQCQLCGGRSTSVFADYEYDILACQDCSHQFADLPGGAAHVDAVYSDSYFSGGGAGYPDYLNEAEIIRAHGRRYAEMLRDHATPGRLLDVGAAAGFVLQGFQDCGWSGVGLEPNHSMARYGRENLGLDIRQGTLHPFQRNRKQVYPPNKKGGLFKKNGRPANKNKFFSAQRFHSPPKNSPDSKVRPPFRELPPSFREKDYRCVSQKEGGY